MLLSRDVMTTALVQLERQGGLQDQVKCKLLTSAHLAALQARSVQHAALMRMLLTSDEGTREHFRIGSDALAPADQSNGSQACADKRKGGGLGNGSGIGIGRRA